MNNQKGSTFIIVPTVILAFLSIAGWVANIVKLVLWTSFDPISMMGIVRIVGVFLAPLGAVMGYIPT